MSLSFVSKAIQTSTDDGGFEEKPIEGAESSSSTTAVDHRPLFEQLRANKEKEDMEREEHERSMMRSTLALDEEDCAHLDALRRQRQEEDAARQAQTQQELAAFRAARMDRNEIKQFEEEEPKEPVVVKAAPAANKPKPQMVPKIVVKKRRNVDDTDEGAKKLRISDSKSEESSKKVASASEEGGLGGLLGGYGSSSDED